MSIYSDRVLPRIVDVALSGREFAAARQRVSAGLAGEVLEVGFGSGRNLPFYPADVTRVFAVEPSPGGRTLAARRVAAAPFPVEYVGLDGQHLPLEDTSVDHVVTTWTLCTIPDVGQALAEFRRVLRPGGSVHFVEHGRSPVAATARWQDRLTPLQRRLFGGCHLNRPIATLLSDAGFAVSHLENYYVRGPKTFGYMYEGAAAKA